MSENLGTLPPDVATLRSELSPSDFEKVFSSARSDLLKEAIDLPTEELTSHHLFRLVTEAVALDLTVPLALVDLARHPQGDSPVGPGGVAASLCSLPERFWMQHRLLAGFASELLDRLVSEGQADQWNWPELDDAAGLSACCYLTELWGREVLGMARWLEQEVGRRSRSRSVRDGILGTVQGVGRQAEER